MIDTNWHWKHEHNTYPNNNLSIAVVIRIMWDYAQKTSYMNNDDSWALQPLSDQKTTRLVLWSFSSIFYDTTLKGILYTSHHSNSKHVRSILYYYKSILIHFACTGVAPLGGTTPMQAKWIKLNLILCHMLHNTEWNPILAYLAALLMTLLLAAWRSCWVVWWCLSCLLDQWNLLRYCHTLS